MTLQAPFRTFKVNFGLLSQSGLLLVLPLIVAGVVGYLLGSFPTAYLMVRLKSRVDIRKAGSGNVGTLNSFMVTKSKGVGVVVLLLDLLKGVAAVTIAPLFGASDPFLAQTVAGAAAVAGHNFPVWLGGKGGRGLATGAGVMLPPAVGGRGTLGHRLGGGLCTDPQGQSRQRSCHACDDYSGRGSPGRNH